MTPENIEKILSTVALGIWPDRAAQIHGISPVAMRKHKQRHPDFVTAIEKAEAEAEAGFHGKILRATEKQWQAAAWMLERRWPNRYAKREPEVQVTVSNEVNVVPDGPPEPKGGDMLHYADRLVGVIGNLRKDQGGKMDGGDRVSGTNGTNGST